MSRGHVVLVGAGHANLLVVRGARRLRRAGLDVTLVDPDAFWYSGMAAAVAGGAVAPRRGRVDPVPLARSRDVTFRRGRVVGLDPGATTVTLDDGSVLQATAVVLNVGSRVDPGRLPTDRAEVVPAKPTTALLDLQDRLLAGTRGARVVVVGGGATAVELACNLTTGEVGRTAAPHVTVVAGARLVPPVDDEVRSLLRDALDRRGVVLEQATRAVDVTDVGVVLDDGRVLPADHVVLATGLRAADLVADLGLGDADGMPTTRTLQHPDHPRVLGAGDAIRFDGTGLPRLGVFAVRQAPVLLDNLLALHGDGALRDYEPQREWVSAIDLGGGEALLLHRGRVLTGRPALVAKRLLDEWFLRRHRVPLGSSGRPPARRGGGPEPRAEAT